MTRILILSTSLSTHSKSRILATVAWEYLAKDSDTRLIDMREHPLPDFDHDTCYSVEAVDYLTEQLAWAQTVVIATPIYNWSTGSVIKKVLENTGTDDTGRKCRAWEDKVITFLATGGIPQSYMACMSIANSLMLDYKCIVNPHFVFAVEDDFSLDGIINDRISARLERVMDITKELTDCLKGRTLLSGWCI